jgi:L-aspartate oxidase
MTTSHIKNVLIIGGGLSGCSLALALAKRDVSVTIIDSLPQQRRFDPSVVITETDSSTSLFNSHDNCPRAMEQITSSSINSIKELVPSLPCSDIYKTIIDQLKEYPQIEWMNDHLVLDLITLDNHSLKKNDLYKRPTCIGAFALNKTTNQVEAILAKEITLATGGATSLFLHSNRPNYAKGNGLAMAHRAGARLITSGPIQFSPLNIYQRYQSCFHLSTELLKMGGKILSFQRNSMDLSDNLNLQLAEELFRTQAEHLWLDLTSIDHGLIRELYPLLEEYCLNHAINTSKELIPIVPTAKYTNTGILVDRTGQTSLNRLHAVGEVACTGLYHSIKNDQTNTIETLIWSVACAENIFKQVGKLAYYFPDIKEWVHASDLDHNTATKDIELIKWIMWAYAGIASNNEDKKRARALLKELMRPYDEKKDLLSMAEYQTMNAIQAALLLIHERP